jgi:3-mercaptopyruvate sulfurtransferase SseA
MALLLKRKGYKVIWPLLGGFDAWLELGYPTETPNAGDGFPDRVSAPDSQVSKEQDNSWA